jgi:hypothetical protein
MKKELCFIIGLIVCSLFSCSEKKETKKGLTLDDCPVVAHQVYINGDTLTVCDLKAVKDTFNIPLSPFLSSFEIIRLENTEEALSAEDGRITVSENYIGVYSFKAGAYKLYNKEGNYLCTLSSPGQGPDEYYIGLYDSYIDEKNGKIYLLSLRTPKLLVFDLKGKALQHIPLSYLTHKGRFIIHPETETLTMMALPFKDTPSVAWIQDFKGNVLQEIPAGQFVINPGDYSNEVWESLNTANLDFSILRWDYVTDTLYHYLPRENRLQPNFTLDFNGATILLHNYIELSGYYLTWLYTQVAWWGEMPRFPKILIDKKTLRGCYVNIKWNMLGNIDGPTKLSFSRGYFTANMEPYKLKEQLEKAISQPEKLTPEMLQKLNTLNNSLTDDDNNILFIGKLK